MRPRKDVILFVNTWGCIDMKKIKIKNKRLSKYLYSLGFNREYIIDKENEYWFFEESTDLNEALDFYFYMRQKTR